jgi:hypothetical protein
MKKIKNLIFIFESFLTKYDFERYGFDFYISQGLKIKILNISPITRSNYFNYERGKNHFVKDFQKNCYSIEDIKKEILEYKNKCAATIIHIGDFEYDYKIRKILKSNNILIIKHFYGGQPFKKKSFFEIFFYTLLDLPGAIQKIKEKIRIFKYKNFKKEDPDITFYVGSKYKPSKKIKSVSLPSFEYDKINFLPSKKFKNMISEEFALYIDVPYRHTDQHEISKRFPKEVPCSFDEYYGTLNRFFKEFEKVSKLKICISSHPRANYKNNPYENYKLYENKTFELSADIKCKVVLLHSSLAINYPVLLQKPIIFLTQSKFTNSNKKNVIDLSRFFEKTPIKMDEDNFDETTYKNQLKMNINLYNSYKNTSYEIIYNSLINNNDNQR